MIYDARRQSLSREELNIVELDVDVKITQPVSGEIWAIRPSSHNNDWQSVAYGDGLFVAVATSGTGNRVMTSPDGITWTSRTSAVDNRWQSVAYGGGLFVAVASNGTGNRVMTSPDGITWTSRTSAADNSWKSVVYGDGLFVAVARTGTGNRVMTSSDGITWTSRTSAEDNFWKSVVYGDGLFVAVARAGTDNRVMTSPDGITWTARSVAVDNAWVCVTYGDGFFVAVSDTGTGNRVMTSPDGIAWTSRVNIVENSWVSVVYGNGLFVAVSDTGTDDRVMTSTANSAARKEYLCDGLVPTGQKFWPCVESIQWVPTRASESGGLGYFGEAAITCRNFDWPNGDGTYFGRLLASNPYTLNRIVKINVGFYEAGEAFNFSSFQERRYFIKKITGPTEKGVVKIEVSDVLSQLKESTCPGVSAGNLNASLTSSAIGTINIQDNGGFSSGYAIIDDEIVSYSGISGLGSIVITSRGQGGTTAEEHDADAPVRHIYHYSGNAVDCVRDLIENYSNVDHNSYIPDADWNAERDTFLSSENVDVWVLEPTPTSDIIDDIGKQIYASFWWQDDAQEIRVKAIGPSLSSDETWNDSENILDSKVTIKRDQRKIITQAWVYYGKIDQSKGNDAANFEAIHINIDQDAEAGLGQPQIKKIFADYIPVAGSATASKIASRIVSQNSNPMEIVLQVDAKDSGLNVGDPVDLSTDLLEGTDGLPVTTKMRIIEKAQAANNRYTYKMVFSGIEQGSRYFVIAPSGLPDYDSATQDQKDKYGWIADTSGKVGAADDVPYLIL